MLKIYNSLTRKKENFIPAKDPIVSMYVCGITVYDDCHIGHARTAIAFDVLYRYLSFRGYQVKYVRNITDIDDKIINRAAKKNISINELTAEYIKRMSADYAELGLCDPSIEPKATEHINAMLNIISELIANKYAYLSQSGDVLFNTAQYNTYGQLGHQDLSALQAGIRIDVDADKKNETDFVLWKRSKAGEPFWDSPWGKGRPGWHIECSAMINEHLGKSIDIHGGGNDLKFPHHENERAQSECFTGKSFVKYWMHVGFVQFNNEKMSKSLNNFFTIKELLKEHHAECLRYFLTASYYRNPVNYHEKSLIQARESLSKLYLSLRDITVIAQDSQQEEEKSEKYLMAFIEAMDDDLNTPKALAIMFELSHELNKIKKTDVTLAIRLASDLKKMGNVLGILQQDPELFLQSVSARFSVAEKEKINLLVKQRDIARLNKDWARADKIRKELDEKHIVLEDTPNGTVWRVYS